MVVAGAVVALRVRSVFLSPLSVGVALGGDGCRVSSCDGSSSGVVSAIVFEAVVTSIPTIFREAHWHIFRAGVGSLVFGWGVANAVGPCLQ